jgi:hypothetical protein
VLSAFPASLTIAPGASTATTIAIQEVGGFTGSVSLAVSGLPNGVAASFSKSIATGSSLLSLTVGNQVSRRIYTLTVTGSSGALSQYSVLSLAVDAAGFSIAASPAAISYNSNGTLMTTITLTSYGGFTGNVALTATANLSYYTGSPTLKLFSTSVPLTANGEGVTQVYVTFPASASAQASPMSLVHRSLPAGSAVLACLLFFSIPARRRSWRAALGMLVLLIALAGGVCACGGGGGGSTQQQQTLPPPSGNFIVTVTGTSSSITEGCAFAVNVP